MQFTIDYISIDNAALTQSQNYLGVNYSAYSMNNTLTLWNEYGEQFLYHLTSFQWKIGSEHTIDNRQYAAELQLIHI